MLVFQRYWGISVLVLLPVIVGKSANLSVLEITLLAIIVYAGAAQFIIAGLMTVATPIFGYYFYCFFS